MIRVIRVIRVLLIRSLPRTPIDSPYTQLITDLSPAPRQGRKGNNDGLSGGFITG
jgi:hypothetical protein